MTALAVMTGLVIVVPLVAFIVWLLYRWRLGNLWRPGDPNQCPLCLWDINDSRCNHPWIEKI